MTEEKVTYESAKTWAKDHKGMMAPDNSLDKGRVADLRSAEEMAIAEQKSRDLEEALKKEAEVGMTDKQEKMLQRIESYKEKYPDVFVEEVANGQRMWFVDNQHSQEQFIFTLNGVFNVWLKTEGSLGLLNRNTLNLDFLSGEITNITKTDNADNWIVARSMAVKKVEEKFFVSDFIVVHEVDLAKDEELFGLKNSIDLTTEQKRQEKENKRKTDEALESFK